MRPFDDHSSLTPDQRRAAVANILAAGILRFQTPAALSDETRELPSPEKPEDSAAPCLEVFGPNRAQCPQRLTVSENPR
jgi:hypothetical protein